MSLSREDAAELVARYTKTVNGFKAVEWKDAADLLGTDDYKRMLGDPIRSLGPTTESKELFFYPWNVIDYLSGYQKPQT